MWSLLIVILVGMKWGYIPVDKRNPTYPIWAVGYLRRIGETYYCPIGRINTGFVSKGNAFYAISLRHLSLDLRRISIPRTQNPSVKFSQIEFRHRDRGGIVENCHCEANALPILFRGFTTYLSIEPLCLSALIGAGSI